jgi:hypothetical protein
MQNAEDHSTQNSGGDENPLSLPDSEDKLLKALTSNNPTEGSHDVEVDFDGEESFNSRSSHLRSRICPISRSGRDGDTEAFGKIADYASMEAGR